MNRSIVDFKSIALFLYSAGLIISPCRVAYIVKSVSSFFKISVNGIPQYFTSTLSASNAFVTPS